MGGAGLAFDNLGVNMVSIVGKAGTPSILYLNRTHGEDIDVQIYPVNVHSVWNQGRGGFYSLIDHVYSIYGGSYATDPRAIAVGPAAGCSDIGALGSIPRVKGKLTDVDTWAARGGFGTKMFREHGIAAIIYGGTFIDEDFRDRKVADQWFENKYNKKLAAKDLEATTKYRYDEKFNTGGTFGVNYAGIGGRIMAFNYKTIYMDEGGRLDMHKRLVIDHYLRQFNEETIAAKQQKTCGEPCAAVCKKMHGEFKKDYEPYQSMGPLCGIFDQRAAEKLAHRADMYGFDAISIGGFIAWLMECIADGHIKPEELGAAGIPKFTPENFDAVRDSSHNADIGVQILDAIVEGRGIVDIREGARKFARRLARERGREVLDKFVYVSSARKGWMVPNQYWTTGVLSPMPIMGKYYMHYGTDFLPPRELGRKNAERLRMELIMDNLGICRFHRSWAEEMGPEIIGSLYGMKDAFLESIAYTASRINSRNTSVFWESERNFDFIFEFMKRRRQIDKDQSPELAEWISAFEKDKKEAALNFWYEIHKGIHESLREF
jgi:glyceraldehyde-3-phosphate dehydrogenase (ferredoxin)